ncbi:uncharacterized protein LOC113867222 isoform X2 [Abrus precatorius]|nr:uncharacterized protein LOC113867222 isoform X2 [Abrus precatorius]XP_027358173.1 uncharacterized protein LOC113867222 isoform X2 [Abrus precatorius]XP_027358174.1 uncharacterized protein LOC113867222 isoform X2 [Abrus precatorius]
MEPTCAAHAMEWSIQLEMALRSTKPGVPVKAILEMEPRLQQWSREPESVIASNAMFGLVPGEDRLFANAILLRLAGAFREGDIKTRLSVVRVFLSEQKHYDNKKKKRCKGLLSEARVANQLELLKQVKSVFDSGDLKSRALALVLFGCWADFSKDNAQIRYLIFSSLVSPHDCEVRASLFATGCFCEMSDDFASIALEMLFNIMNSSSASLLVKLTAARVLAKCKSSYSIAHKAYKMGMELVFNSLDEDVLVAMLFSLSKLASILMLFNSNQVDFLLSFLNQERTAHVRETGIKCLHFLFEKDPCLHPVNSGLIHGLFSIMEEPGISMAMQYKALKVLHKVLLSIPPSLLHVEFCEFVKLLNVAENTRQYPVSRNSCLAIRILADLCCRTVDRTNNVNGVFCCSSLPSRVISLIKDHIKLLVMPLLKARQNDLTICQDLQGLLKILLIIVETHPYLGSLALDNIKSVVEYLVTVASTDHAVPSAHLAVDFKVEKNNFFILKLIRKIYRFLVACLENLYKASAINAEVLSRVKILADLVCQCSLIDCYTYTMYHLLLHNQPVWDGLDHENDETHDYLCIYPDSCLTKCTEFVKKVLTETDGWTAYKVGAHAACQGEWLLATTIFRTLIEKVKSDSCCSWLKSLFHYAHSEGKIQLLSLPKQGTTSMELLETVKFPLNPFDYMDKTCPNLAGHINDSHYYDELTQSHVALCSSLKILEASVKGSQAFCFQRWFLSLRSRVLENLVGLFNALREVSLNLDGNFNQVEFESSDMLQGLKSCKVISQISFQLCRLAEEFDLFGRSVIGMDSESSAFLASHGLSCSVLAFAAAFGVSNIEQYSHGIFVGDKTSCNLQALTIQHLMRQLWCVDHEIRASLSLLLDYFDQNKNSLPLLHMYQTWNIGYKDRAVLDICSYAVSCAVRLQNERTASQFTKNALLLTFNTLIKWMHIHFRIPRFFFEIRQFVGSELYVHNEDSTDGVAISVLPGFHLTLNICLQLKNVSLNLHAKAAKLYCILHCSTTSLVSDGETVGHSCSGYEAWKDDEIVELNKKLFYLVLDNMADKRTRGLRNRGNVNRVVEAFLDFEPNEKGQGFSLCTLDVSDFPVGSYRIKWHSCLVDSHDSYWSLLPLNLGPVFVIKTLVG